MFFYVFAHIETGIAIGTQWKGWRNVGDNPYSIGTFILVAKKRDDGRMKFDH